jgi:hypothetical protein
MPMNRIQFQQGMSLPEFLRSFGTEEQCVAAVAAARWPDGFVCPRCAASSYWTVKHQGRELFQCGACRHQTSLTASTMFASTKLPLATWFLAIYLLSQAKTGLSALALKRQIGVSYPTAWLMHHKPNVRAKRATTAGRQARAGENVPRTTGPGLVACRWRSA